MAFRQRVELHQAFKKRCQVIDHDHIRTVRRRFDVVGEELRGQIRTVAEGLQGLREVTTTEFKAIRDEIAESQAMIRLSFGELDRRIRS